jgi:3-oxoacyl-[acyl-carrier protein] reductase
MIQLANKTAVITGASRGIGAAVAKKLAQCGANVALLARSEGDIKRLATDIGEQALPIVCDVSNYIDVQQAITQCAEHFGGVDICVNNAGIIDPIARIENSDPVHWGQVVDINVKGVYYCLHAVYPYLKDRGGVIINLSSGAAMNALEGWSHYCATKAAVLSLTKCAHMEWASQGIRVVGLSPGTVATDMQELIKKSGINPVSQMDWSAHISVEDVAQAVAWLTQNESSEFDGQDFSLKTPAGRVAAGLAPL